MISERSKYSFELPLPKDRTLRSDGERRMHMNIDETFEILRQWLADPGKTVWIPLKLYLADFDAACKPMGQFENQTHCWNRFWKAEKFAYRLQHLIYPTSVEFFRDYIALKKRGAPLISFDEANALFPTEPSKAIEALFESLATWQCEDWSRFAKPKSAPRSSVGGILPTIKQLKVNQLLTKGRFFR